MKDIFEVKEQRGLMYRREPKDIVPIETLEHLAYLKAVRGMESLNLDKKIDEYTDLANYAVFVLERLYKSRDALEFARYHQRYNKMTYKPIAIIDCDETLWGFNTALHALARDKGIKLPKIEECDHWDALYVHAPREAVIPLFDEIHANQCSDLPFSDAKPFLEFMKKRFYVVIASHRNGNYRTN